jgi:hypothetical protein
MPFWSKKARRMSKYTLANIVADDSSHPDLTHSIGTGRFRTYSWHISADQPRLAS